jgi:aminopeptidase N
MRKYLPFIFFLFIASCTIFGVHYKIHNPSRAGKYPKKTEARVLLGNQDTKFRTCYDVKYYNLQVDFGYDLEKNHSISGDVFMLAKAVGEVDTIQIDLSEKLHLQKIFLENIGSMDSIALFNKVELKTFRKANAVFAIMPNKIHAGRDFLLETIYDGVPLEAKRPPWSGGFVWKKDNLGKTWDAVACETEGASLWWACKDVMNDEPDSVDISYAVPAGLKAISNGKLVSVGAVMRTTYLDDTTRNETVFHWHVSYPINLYDITFYIGNYKLLHETYYSEVTHDTLQLNHYVLEQNYDKAVTHFQQLKKYLAFYEQTFGPYPWYRDGFKLVESPYAGMEHQSAIAYGNGYKDDPRNGFDYIILHETAHEWWGNSVTASDLADGWLHEGFATYAEALYVEKTKGRQAAIRYLWTYHCFIINRRPVVGEHGIRYFDYHDEDIYMKGAWVLHSLRYAIGNDSLFFDIIHSFYMENKMTEISSDKFEEIVNRKTGKDFHWFFQTYLHDRFTPELEYCVHDGNIYYRWNKTEKDFQMKVRYTEVLNKYDSKLTFSAEIAPVPLIINKVEFRIDKDKLRFNEIDFLYKPVENKNLWKEFNRQK